ncbi:hypothetical protein [Dokdonia sp. 4H-3-7-5]|jgi:DNA-binding transcriptional regulator YbjK|uniref:hypothetical protein n=1 Tax=Dokdonia sp. (strain 4H-3-7-5) TaxID=983548 RepID=UPI00020A737A|nr:hypothetical protein [Dokdonia sp. 4H-3-7-5]AEE20862.1 hypothetical protein Krodi_2888 [Dokdonia sp. 4H-3-7-5]
MELENKILKDLFESIDGLYAYTFYSRYKIEPDEIIKFISKYQEKGVVTFDDNKINLSKEGREIILKQQFQPKTAGNKFANIPKEFLASKLKINEPYLPNINDVSADILLNKKVV